MTIKNFPGRPLASHTMWKGEELELQHSYVDWLAKRSLTADSIAISVTRTEILSFTQESFTSGVLIGEVMALDVGETTLVLTLTAGARVKKTVFKFTVLDPAA